MTDDEGKTVEWLCGDDNPPVRYLTRKNLLGIPEAKLKEDRIRINKYPVVRNILRNHKTFWGKDKHLYQKYKGGYWNLIFLGDLFADGSDPVIRKGVEFILSDERWHRAIDKQSSYWICLSSNIARAMAVLGYADDPRLKAHIENIGRAIVNNDGIVCSVMDYSLLPQCYMALPKVLMALGSYRGKNRVVNEAVKIASEKLLEKSIYRYVPDKQPEWNKAYEKLSSQIKGSKTTTTGKRTLKDALAEIRPGIWKRTTEFMPKQGWLKFGYPLHYNSDILEVMRSMADAGVKYDSRMDNALDIIESKKLQSGRWKMEFSLNGKMWVDIEKRGQPSKWITYHAMRVLRTFGRLEL